MPDRLMTLNEVAERANLNVRTVERHVEKGALPVVRVGPSKRPRVKPADAARYLGEHDEHQK